MTVATPVKISDIVSKYIALRDKKQALARAQKQELGKYDAVLDKMEAILLASYTKAGVESMKTPAGTAYKTTRVQNTVADRDAFLSWVFDNEAPEFLQSRVNTDAVEGYYAEHDELPPGLSRRTEVVINVRRT